MTMKLTPPLNIKGIFKLKSPWEVKEGHIYTCIAVRKFEEVILQHEDIYDNVYRPKRLQPGLYDYDRSIGASLVTLLSDRGDTIIVPDTYILSFPDANIANYSRIILACDLGPLPQTLGIDHIKSIISVAVNDALGTEPTIETFNAPLDNPLTVEDAERAEVVRKNAIKNRTTNYQTVTSLKEKVSITEGALSKMTKYCKRLEAKIEELSNVDGTDTLEKDKEISRLTESVSTLNSQIISDKAKHDKAIEDLELKYSTEITKLNKLLKEKELEASKQLAQLRKSLEANLLPEEVSKVNRILQVYQDKTEGGNGSQVL